MSHNIPALGPRCGGVRERERESVFCVPVGWVERWLMMVDAEKNKL